MDPKPDKTTLLHAVEKFLDDKVRPSVADPALVFRLRIATHLLQVVQRELTSGPGLLAADAARLETLVGQKSDPEAALVAMIESGEADADVRAYLLSALAADLAINQPRFDLSMDPEAP